MNRLLLAALLAGLPLSAGCDGDATAKARSASAGEAPSPDELQTLLDTTLDQTFQDRRLDLQEHAAWQILHGVLAYQKEFLVDSSQGPVPAVQHLLDGGAMKGWQVEPGVEFEDGKVGLRALLEAGSKSGQGHSDQWFAILSQCGLPPDQPVVAGGRTYTMRDMLAQIRYDVPRNVQREYSWTLIGLTIYMPTDVEWTAMDGQQWSVERLVEIELDQDLDSSACGGTHRLIGLAMALARHRTESGQLTGVWAEADEYIRENIERARQLQNADGSFSTNYFARVGTSPDLAQNLGSSGHVLEFLTLAMPPEDLQQAWVVRSVEHLCQLLDQTRDIPLECGALYHAVHGLVLYRTRVYGRRQFGEGAGD